MMKYRLQALATASLLAAGAAQADQSYLLDLSLGGIHFFDAFECPGTICATPSAPFSATGVITVVVDSAVSGMFTGSHFLSLSFAPTSGPAEAFGSASGSPFSVTVLDGVVTSLDAKPDIGRTAQWTFSGLSVGYIQSATHHVGPYSGFGAVTPVPEPSTFASLIGGLGAAAFALMLRRRLRGAR